jgi:uncharacterized protein (DUF1800 family)
MNDSHENASLFLMQSTLGADYETIDAVTRQGIENWLDAQLDGNVQAGDSYLEGTQTVWNVFRKALLDTHGEAAINGAGNDPALPYWYYFRMAWWDKALSTQTEQLVRQRVAQALSEIIVISDKSNLQLNALGMASFYDILYKNAFGSYRDILEAVSLHPVMGVYLSHMNNAKEDPANNIHPDENYAREIMQLFTIGLHELNADGSEKKDANGNPIPTYDNGDIKQLAKVFTGFKAASYEFEWNSNFGYNGTPVLFNNGVSKTYKTVPFINMTQSMVAEEQYHDKTAKSLLGGRINIPKDQSAVDDVRKAVSDLMHHPNTAPFIAKRMIQQLVTSNPSPSYVSAVAARFGTQGDMKAMVKEILTHSEARNAHKLKSPFLRATQILKGFNASNRSGKHWVIGDSIDYTLNQHVCSAPTVFNFYLPDYAPHGPVADAGLVAPEFQIHNSATAIGYVNLMYQWCFGGFLPSVSTVINSTLTNVPELEFEKLEQNLLDKLHFDFSTEIEMARQNRFDDLIERISLILTGAPYVPFKAQIKEAFANYTYQPEWVVQTVVFMIVISPEFTVLKG